MASLIGRGVAAIAAASLVCTGFLTLHGTQRAGHVNAAVGANVDWPRLGNTSNNTRFSPLTQINASNVSKLGVAWTMQEGPRLSTFENFPVVVNGIMYITTNLDQVRAVNAATGKTLWQFTPKVNFYEAIAGGGGGIPTNRGVEVRNGRVYLLTFDDQLIALQSSTGEKLWSTSVANPADGYSETSPPTYWNGMLFVGSAESDAGLRGFVAAYNANTGKQLWRFYTVPAAGHGWMPATGDHGGGDVWMPQLVDEKTGLLYFGTGNPSPDFDNRLRPGCNPYVDSTVALNARTGKLVWAHNEVCPDVWDYDSHQQPMIFDLQMNGKTIHAVGHGNKSGVYFVYDAATGKVLSKTAHLGNYTMPHLHPNPTGVRVCPGTQGGFEYVPPAYDPANQAIYIEGSNTCQVQSIAPLSQVKLHRTGAIDLGGNLLPSGKSTGYVAAISATTGKVLWTTNRSAPMIGGVMATASNLVFGGGEDGRFNAWDAKTGKTLWSPNLGLGFGAPPITYMVNGTQYVAVAAGGANAAKFAGSTLPPGGTLAVFKLNGKPIKTLPPVNTAFVPTTVTRPSIKGLAKVNSWMYMDQARHRVVMTITAAATPNNNGFNFDGYAKGAANFIVPAGWTVDWIFTNKSPIPHSAAVTKTLTPNGAAFSFGLTPAATPNPVQGSSVGQQQYVSFNTTTAGKFYLVCLVPGHIQSGMWDYFTISTTATTPSVTAH